jgi:hypothetical protein
VSRNSLRNCSQELLIPSNASFDRTVRVFAISWSFGAIEQRDNGRLTLSLLLLFR